MGTFRQKGFSVRNRLFCNRPHKGVLCYGFSIIIETGFFATGHVTSSVQSVLERNRPGLHLPTTGAGCSTKTPSIQIWCRKGQIWEPRRGSTLTQPAELFGFRRCASHPVARNKPSAMGASLPFYRGTKHDRTMTQRRVLQSKA